MKGKKVYSGAVLVICTIYVLAKDPLCLASHRGQESPGKGRTQVLGEECSGPHLSFGHVLWDSCDDTGTAGANLCLDQNPPATGQVATGWSGALVSSFVQRGGSTSFTGLW